MSAVDTPRDEPFLRTFAESLRTHGVAEADADRVATLIVAAVEGTVAMCRAQRSIDALDRVTDALTRLVADTVPGERA